MRVMRDRPVCDHGGPPQHCPVAQIMPGDKRLLFTVRKRKVALHQRRHRRGVEHRWQFLVADRRCLLLRAGQKPKLLAPPKDLGSIQPMAIKPDTFRPIRQLAIDRDHLSLLSGSKIQPPRIRLARCKHNRASLRHNQVILVEDLARRQHRHRKGQHIISAKPPPGQATASNLLTTDRSCLGQHVRLRDQHWNIEQSHEQNLLRIVVHNQPDREGQTSVQI